MSNVDGGRRGGRPRPGISRHARANLARAARHVRARVLAQALPAQPAAQQPPVQQPPVDPYDPSADPTLQRIRAFGAQRLADAQAAAINARTQEATDYGAVQAGDARDQHDQPIQLTANQSRENLGYSSTGAVQQSDLSRALAAAAAEHSRSHLDRLQGIQDALTGVQQDVASNDIQAQQDAADRLRETLGDLNVGGSGGGGGGGGGGHGGHHTTGGAAGHAAHALARELRRNRRRGGQPAHLPGNQP